MSHQFMGKKVSFSVSISIDTVYRIRNLHKEMRSKENFSEFVSKIIRLGIAKTLEMSAKQRTIEVDKILSDNSKVEIPIPKRKKTRKRVVTTKKK